MKSNNLNTKQDRANVIGKSYDDRPYDSHPFVYTRPEFLRTRGVLFGLNPPKIETARILELGCSSGGSLINFACNYPKSYTLGIDLSQVQIDLGKKVISDLKLKNIELKCLSILDIDESFGKFDYIICHGVFAWVPLDVQNKILEISSKLLNKDGISFISYNAMPGWNMMKTIREMMLFHASMFHDSNDKLQQAKLFLKFINEALEGSNTPYAKFLREEVEKLFSHGDYYLAHEYLEDQNTPLYFHQFMDMAKSYNLQYLADANLSSMFVGNMPPKAAEKLQAVSDIIRQEQYMDFIRNHRFRTTLLCSAGANINRNIDLKIFDQFYTTIVLSAEKAESEINIENDLERCKFYVNDSKDITVDAASSVMKAILYVYVANRGNPIKIDELAKLAKKKLNNPKIQLADIKKEFMQNIAKLLFSGYLKIYESKPKSINKISDKPKVSTIAIYQAQHATTNKMYVTNQENAIVALQNASEKYIMQMLDGKNTIEQIEQGLLKQMLDKQIIASQDGANITDEDQLRKISKLCVENVLQKCKVNHLLIA